MREDKRFLPELLDRYLTRIQSEEVDVGAYLDEVAQETEELLPLLRVASEVYQGLCPEEASKTFISTSPDRVINRARASRRRWRKTARRRRIRRLPWSWRPAYVLVSALIAFVMLVSSAGVAWASSDALPGDALYGVKRGIEETRLALTLSSSGDLNLLESFAQERLTEVDQLLSMDQSEDIQVALEGYDEMVVRLTALIEKETDGSVPGSLEHVQTRLSKHIETLERVRNQVPSNAQDAIDNAIERSRHSQDVIEEVRTGGSPSDLAPGQLKKTPSPGSEDQSKSEDKEKNSDREKTKKTPGPPPWVTPGYMKTKSP
jgi:hypothetical protein